MNYGHEIKRIRHVADCLDVLPAKTARVEVEQIHRFLTEKILPHNAAEDATVYPVVARLIGGDDPTAPMSRAHLEIAHMVRVLGRHLSDLPPEGPAIEDIRDLRRILYGLDAILRASLHSGRRSVSRADGQPARGVIDSGGPGHIRSKCGAIEAARQLSVLPWTATYRRRRHSASLDLAGHVFATVKTSLTIGPRRRMAVRTIHSPEWSGRRI